MAEKRVPILTLREMKESKEKIVMLTAYDYPTARVLDEAGVEVILVGDSLGMTGLGYETTLPVTMEEMVHHTKAVARGAKRSLVVGDMPFMSYQASVEEAVRNAGRFIKEGNAHAVKLEGGREILKVVSAMMDIGIPVMGHIGLTPQSIHKMGGYRIQGRTADAAERLLSDALALEEAGIFSLVLEGIPWQVAKIITENLRVPTIGIGAGFYCDGQVLVTNDLLGLFFGFVPKFVKKYANLRETMAMAFKQYRDEVKEGLFPGLEHSFYLEEIEAKRLEEMISAKVRSPKSEVKL